MLDAAGRDDALEEVLAAVQASAAAHLCEVVAEADLVCFEERLGSPLPPALRCFLARAGHGLFFGRHEVLGPHPLVLHDIEFVPSMLGVRAHLGLGQGLLPFHRLGDVVHVVDLDAARFGEVASADGSTRWPEPVAFLKAVLAR